MSEQEWINPYFTTTEVEFEGHQYLVNTFADGSFQIELKGTLDREYVWAPGFMNWSGALWHRGEKGRRRQVVAKMRRLARHCREGAVKDANANWLRETFR